MYTIENKRFFHYEFPVTIGDQRWYLERCTNCDGYGFIGHEHCPKCTNGWYVDQPITVLKLKDKDCDYSNDGKRFDFDRCNFKTLDPEKHLNRK